MGLQSAMNQRSDRERAQRGLRTAGLGIGINAALVVLKAVIGVLGHSQALIADAVHSGGDLGNSCIAFASFLFSRRPPDWNHPYGHERIEAFSSTIAASFIFVAGAAIGYDAIIALVRGDYTRPAMSTLLAAGIALVIKFCLGIYTRHMAARTRSKSLGAEARDNAADVVVSLVVIIGILCSRLGATWFDPLASLGVTCFILATAFSIWRDAAGELLDTSLTPAQRREILAIVSGIDGVRHVHAIAGRTIGHTILVELHADVDPALTVEQGARVVDTLKATILQRVPEVRTVVVELNTDRFEPDALQLMAPPPRG